MNFLMLLVILISLIFFVRVIQPWANNYSIPYPSLLLVIGFVSSEIVTYYGFDIGKRYNFNLIVNYFILPLLIFEMAFSLNASNFFRKIVPIIVLAIPVTILSTGVVASILFFGIDHAEFPIIAAVIAAALLSTSDPISINSLTNKSNNANGLVSLLKGESLFNGLVVTVLLTISLDVVKFEHTLDSITFFEVYVIFIKLFSGGIFTGFICGFVGWIILKNTNIKSFNAIVSLVVASTTFAIAKLMLDVSGILAVLVAGLMFNAQVQHKAEDTKLFLKKFWTFNTNITRTFLYLMLGVYIYIPLLHDNWVEIVIGITATLFARAILIFLGFGMVGKFSRQFYLPMVQQIPLFLGSIKGAIVIALVFSLPEDLPYSKMVQAIVCGMVIFSLLIQAPLLKIFLPKDKI